jgi:hypothetical protein
MLGVAGDGVGGEAMVVMMLIGVVMSAVVMKMEPAIVVASYWPDHCLVDVELMPRVTSRV